MKCECGGELTSNELFGCDSYYECKCGKEYYAKDLMEIIIKLEARAEKAEALNDSIIKILEKNPYPESVFTKVTDAEFEKIHEILQREMNMPIDRLSGEYMRMARKQIFKEIKAEKAKEV